MCKGADTPARETGSYLKRSKRVWGAEQLVNIESRLHTSELYANISRVPRQTSNVPSASGSRVAGTVPRTYPVQRELHIWFLHVRQKADVPARRDARITLQVRYRLVGHSHGTARRGAARRVHSSRTCLRTARIMFGYGSLLCSGLYWWLGAAN